MKNNANLAVIFVGSVFSILGSIFVVIGFNFIVNNIRFKAEAVSIEGVIANIETERYRNSKNEVRTRHVVSVDYTVNGVKYENTVYEYRSSMRIGDGITLYYLPDAPWIVRTGLKNDTVGGAFFMGIGGIFFIIGIVFLINIIKKSALKKYLLQHGKMIYAKVIDVEKDTTVFVSAGTGSRGGPRHYPYSFLKCAVVCPVTDEIRSSYKSASVKDDYLGSYVGKQVKVYLHPSDNKKYYVDLDDLMGK